MAATTAEDFAAATSLPLEGVPHHLSEEVDAAVQQQEGGVVPQLLHDLQQQEAAAWGQIPGAVVGALDYAQTAATAAENVLEDAAALAAQQANGAVVVDIISDTGVMVHTTQEEDDEQQQQQQQEDDERQRQLSNSTGAAAETGEPTPTTNAAAEGDDAGATSSPTGDSVTTDSTKEKEEKVLKFFVGGVYPQATELQIRSYFERYGKVKGVELKMDRMTGRNRGFAFVTMADESARDAVFRGQHVLGGKKIEVRALHDDGYEALKRKIFVGGVNPSLSEEEIGNYFGKFGTVEKVSIIRDATTGKSRGFGFVVFADESSVKDVLKSRRHNLNDKDSCEVRAAEARAALPSTRRFFHGNYPMYGGAPGGRGGGGGGGNMMGGSPGGPAPVMPPSYFPAHAHPAGGAYYPGRSPAAAPVAAAPAPAYYYGPPPPALGGVATAAPPVAPYYATAAPAAAPPVHPHMVGATAATPYAQHHPQAVPAAANQYATTALTTSMPMVTSAQQQQTVGSTNIYGTTAAPAGGAPTAYDPNAVAAAGAASAAANARVAASSYWGEDQSAVASHTACYGVARTSTAAPAAAVARPAATTAVTAATSYGGYSPVRQSPYYGVTGRANVRRSPY